VNLYFYFSWRDLRAAFVRLDKIPAGENLRGIICSKKGPLKKEYIVQRRNVRGTFEMSCSVTKSDIFRFHFVLKDLFGWNSFVRRAGENMNSIFRFIK
jgi:hypothetical protein